METIDGNNPTQPSVPPKETANSKLKAAMEQFASAYTTEKSGTAPSASIEPTPTESPKVEAPAVKSDVMSDPQKLEKSTQHLEAQVVNKEEQLRKAKERYLELQRKFTPLSQDLKKEQSNLVALQNNMFQEISSNQQLTPEFKSRLRQDLEKEPEETIVRLTAAMARMEADKVRAEREADVRKMRDERVLSRLDQLASEAGNEWLLTDEGQRRLDETLNRKPFLMQSDDPFGDALRFVDKSGLPSGTHTASAQSGQGTPILGSNRGVPPSNFMQPTSDMQELAAARDSLIENMRDPKTRAENRRKLDQIAKRMLDGLRK